MDVSHTRFMLQMWKSQNEFQGGLPFAWPVEGMWVVKQMEFSLPVLTVLAIK